MEVEYKQTHLTDYQTMVKASVDTYLRRTHYQTGSSCGSGLSTCDKAGIISFQFDNGVLSVEGIQSLSRIGNRPTVSMPCFFSHCLDVLPLLTGTDYVILQCPKKHIGFYQKFGFLCERNYPYGVMRMDLGKLNKAKLAA